MRRGPHRRFKRPGYDLSRARPSVRVVRPGGKKDLPITHDTRRHPQTTSATPTSARLAALREPNRSRSRGHSRADGTALLAGARPLLRGLRACSRHRSPRRMARPTTSTTFGMTSAPAAVKTTRARADAADPLGEAHKIRDFVDHPSIRAPEQTQGRPHSCTPSAEAVPRAPTGCVPGPTAPYRRTPAPVRAGASKPAHDGEHRCTPAPVLEERTPGRRLVAGSGRSRS